MSTVKLLKSTVNEQDSQGRTPLFFAATGAGLFGSKRGNKTITRALLQNGANPNIKDNHGKTALDYAMESGSDWLIVQSLKSVTAK